MCPFQNAERAFPVTDLRFSEQARLYTPATLWFQVKKPVCASQPCLLCQMTTNFMKSSCLSARVTNKRHYLPISTMADDQLPAAAEGISSQSLRNVV